MLGTAIVGCGAIVADLHVQPLRRLQHLSAVDVRVLVDRDPARALTLRRWFPDARVATSLTAGLEPGDIQLAFIATPPSLHRSLALDALQAGSHVFCEKPLATRAADAQELARAADAAGRVLAVAHPRRFFPNTAAVRSRIMAGDLGEPLQFVLREGSPYEWPIATDAAFRRETAGGGVLLDKGVHCLDTLDSLFGVGQVLACWDDSLRGGVETNSKVELAYSSARGLVHLSWDQALNNGLWIRGPLGEIRMDSHEIDRYHWRSPGTPWQQNDCHESWPSDLTSTGGARRTPHNYYDCGDLEWINLVRSIHSLESPAVDGIVAARVLQEIEDAYRIAQPLDQPWLAPSEQAFWRDRHWHATGGAPQNHLTH